MVRVFNCFFVMFMYSVSLIAVPWVRETTIENAYLFCCISIIAYTTVFVAMCMIDDSNPIKPKE